MITKLLVLKCLLTWHQVTLNYYSKLLDILQNHYVYLLEQTIAFQLIIIGIVRRYKTIFLLQGITQESVHSWVYTSTLPDTWVHLQLITWYLSTFTYTYLIHDYAYMNTLHEYHTGTLLLRCIILYLLTWILVLRTTRMIY